MTITQTTLVSRRVLDSLPSATVAIADAASEMRRRGIDVVDFSAGRAAEPTPEYIIAAAVSALNAGDTHQTPAAGRPAYRAACAAKLLRDNGIIVDPETEIIATLGCKQGLTLALLALLDPGDEIIVEDPGFVSYAPVITLMGARPVPVPLRAENHFRWDMDELKKAIGPRTRTILLCSPHNPTGTVHTREDLTQIATLACRHNLTVISDEIYERNTWGGRRHIGIATLPGMAERTVTLMGLTKSFSMGGWRIGFAFASAPVISAMVTLQQHLITCAGSFTQAGALVALESGATAEVHALWNDWELRCRFMTEAIDELPEVSCAMPEGGFYAWADIRGLGISSAELSEYLIREYAVAVVPGSAFGAHGEGYLRLTCVRSWDEVRRGISRITEAFHRLPAIRAK
jgi:aspartate aminotransferase